MSRGLNILLTLSLLTTMFCSVDDTDNQKSFLDHVKNQEAINEVEKKSYATFDKDSILTIDGIRYSQIDDITSSSASYTSPTLNKTILVNLSFDGNTLSGATFEVMTDGKMEATVSTKFLSYIVQEKLNSMADNYALDATTDEILGELSTDGKIFVNSGNLTIPDGMEFVYSHYIIEEDVLLYNYSGLTSSVIKISVSGSTGTVKVDQEPVISVNFSKDPVNKVSFKDNIVGSYSLNSSAVLDYNGNKMYFNGNDIRFQVMIVNGDKLYMHLYVNGNPTTNTLRQIRFDENSINSGGNEEMLIINNSTNAILNNTYIITENDFIYDADVDLDFNPANGDLSILGTKIGTKISTP